MRLLVQKLERAVYAYDYDKPHALNKMSPVEYEENLKSIPMARKSESLHLTEASTLIQIKCNYPFNYNH